MSSVDVLIVTALNVLPTLLEFPALLVIALHVLVDVFDVS